MKNLIIKKRRNGSKIQAGQTSRKSVPDIGSYVLFFKVMFSAMIDMINATAEIAIEAHNKTITPRHLVRVKCLWENIYLIYGVKSVRLNTIDEASKRSAVV